MASLFSTGPAHLWVANHATMPGKDPLSIGTPLYLGTAEGAPQINVEPIFTPVNNDIGGVVPFDYMFHGAEAIIAADLTRWNEAIYAQCVAWPNAFANTRGTFESQDVGTLMLTEGMCYDIWVQFPYASKAFYTAQGMVAGYHFLAGFMIGPEGILPGTRTNKRSCMFKAMRAYDPATGKFKLYDHVMTGLSAIPPNNSTGSASSSS